MKKSVGRRHAYIGTVISGRQEYNIDPASCQDCKALILVYVGVNSRAISYRKVTLNEALDFVSYIMN